MNELKPCPFCGGEARIAQHKYEEPQEVTYSVECEEFRCPAFACGEFRFDTEREAIDAWNTRAERTCRQEERGWGTEGDHARVWLDCGHDCMVPTVQNIPNYCPNCGAKVVSE